MLHIITALHCEAKPLIKHYRLNGRQADGFRIYEKDPLRLIICGVGKVAAAAACAYLQGLAPDSRHAWLNIGIAGHPTLNIGEGMLASKITDQSSGQAWYPPLVFEAPCQRMELVTVDTAAYHYQGDHAHDMEATGFYATACRFNSAESVQAFKVISDNNDHSAENISAAHAQEIISANLSTIDQLIKQLSEVNGQLREQIQSPTETAHFLDRWHFTTTQQHQLIRLLQRWRALQPNKPISTNDFSKARNSKELLKLLTSQLQNLATVFD